MTGRVVEVEVEACDAARTLNDVDQVLPVRQVRAEQEVVVAAGLELEDAGVTVDDDRAAVRRPGYMLNAGDCPRGEVGNQRVPVERTAKREAKEQTAVGCEAVALPPSFAQLAR